jgi:signal transduction histidine kinase
MLFCLVQDAEGRLWMGTDGVSRYDPRTGEWRNWDCFSTKINENVAVMSCLKDAGGGLWFGSNRGGLFRYDPKADRMEEVILPPEAYNDGGRLRIVNMQLDARGRIWMATYHRPMRFDPRSGHVEIFQIKNGKPTDNAWTDVHPAGSGLLYATSGNSLLELDSACAVLRRFDQTNGMRSNEVYLVEEDRLGRLWVNTSHLLHCLDPKTGRFTYYGTDDGLFKNTVTDALVTLPDGEMFIGFQNAFNYFHPTQLQRNTAPPPVAITSMKVMDKERRLTVGKHFRFSRLFSKKNVYSLDTMLVVRPRENIFTIQFAALVFIQPRRNRYAYKLEGFDEDWVYTDRNFATYTNLDGGEYLFRVKAANNDGVWNEKGTELQVKVIPPLTERWYFFVLAGIFCTMILMSVWQYRRRQRRRLEAYRESLARDLHDEMGSTLSSIRFFGEYAKTQLDGHHPHVAAMLQRIILTAGALSESMQDIVWAMRRNNDQLEDLGVRMTDFGLRIFEARNIAFKTCISEEFSGKFLSPEARRNLYLIFKESVNNAAKYAAATEVQLSLSIKKGWLLMEITDDGVGFTQGDSLSPGNGGNGLQSMRKRARDIGGTLEILTEKQRGTTIAVRVRL